MKCYLVLNINTYFVQTLCLFDNSEFESVSDDEKEDSGNNKSLTFRL